MIATILNPAAKLEKFTTASWIDDGINWIEVYQQVFFQVFEYYKQKHSEISVEAVHTTQCTKLDHAWDQIHKRQCISHHQQKRTTFAEIEIYLNED